MAKIGKFTLLRRTIPAFILAGLLSGCGFSPLYGARNTNGTSQVSGNLAQVAIGIIPNRPGQLLREALEQRLDDGIPATEKRYNLTVSYGISSIGLGVQPDSSLTYIRMIANASWALHSQAPGAPVLVQGNAQAIDGYNILDQQYFAANLENNAATRRLAKRIAGQIALQLATYFAQHKGV